MTRCSASIRRLQRAFITTLFDAAGGGSPKASCALMLRAKADKFRSAISAAKPSLFQADVPRETKKPDMYWSAPRTAVGRQNPMISVVEIVYVRRSEPSAYEGRLTHNEPFRFV